MSANAFPILSQHPGGTVSVSGRRRQVRPPGALFEGARGLLKHLDRWTLKERLLIPETTAICAGTVVEQVLLFRRALSGVLDDSDSRAEAHAKGDALATSSCSSSLMILGRPA